MRCSIHRMYLEGSDGFEKSEPLPADAGSIAFGVQLQVPQHDIFGHVSCRGREIPARPEPASPIASAQRGELHLYPARRAAFDPLHHHRQCQLRRHRDVHIRYFPSSLVFPRICPFCWAFSTLTAASATRTSILRVPRVCFRRGFRILAHLGRAKAQLSSRFCAGFDMMAVMQASAVA